MRTRHAKLIFALLVSVVLNAGAETHYVDLNSPNPTSPYTNWLTAATNIQDAVDVATNGDLVIVTNGLYATGGRLAAIGIGVVSNRLVLDKAILVRSVNGPQSTTIQGYQVPGTTNGDGAVRCVYFGPYAATLSGFTLTNGATASTNFTIERLSGGGALCASGACVLSNCIVVGNSAYGSGGGVYSGTLFNCVVMNNTATRSTGGGVYSSTLANCLLIGNRAEHGGGAYVSVLSRCMLQGNTALGDGGGASYGKLNNCVVTGNKAMQHGGGAANAALNNCTIVSNSASSYAGGIYYCNPTNSVIYYNLAPSNPNDYQSFLQMYCCNTDVNGVGNFTNAPIFVDIAAGDFRLQSNSPCINAGTNGLSTGSVDLDGNQRISGGTVDMGAFEFQSPASVLSYIWAQKNGLLTDGTVDFADADGDGANNWQEWRADTSPTNAASILLMGPVSNGVTGLVVSWTSVPTRSYRLERATNLSDAVPFQVRAVNLPGVAGTKTFTDTSATNGGPYFYRIGVQ